MSELSSRGNSADVAPAADLSPEAAQRWLERHRAKHSAEEEARRAAHRQECLQSSVAVGACGGLVGSLAGWKWLKSRSAGFQRAVGGSGAAFTLFATFFVPFVFTTNRFRIRCSAHNPLRAC
jgi:hypothetical protein